MISGKFLILPPGLKTGGSFWSKKPILPPDLKTPGGSDFDFGPPILTLMTKGWDRGDPGGPKHDFYRGPRR